VCVSCSDEGARSSASAAPCHAADGRAAGQRWARRGSVEVGKESSMLGRPKATKADADLACERSWLLPVRRGLPGIPIRREEVQ
jgi:hypothetical protein